MNTRPLVRAAACVRIMPDAPRLRPGRGSEVSPSSRGVFAQVAGSEAGPGCRLAPAARLSALDLDWKIGAIPREQARPKAPEELLPKYDQPLI
jgi:hypothetical protein